MENRKVRTAVVGVGAFGENHARVLSKLDESELVAVVDSDRAKAEAAAQRHGCAALTDFRELAGRVDAVCVAVPTVAHAEVGAALLEAGVDVLVEKPIAADLAEADALLAAAQRNGRILEVGHLERFNPAVEAGISAATLPLFFEVHRLGMFTARSVDIDVVLDLMIHDLDILFAMVDSPVNRIEAAGLPILSTQADIASVRIIFENGCVANLTASRISTEKVRKLRYFQPRQYVSVDYTRQDGVVIGLDANNQLQFKRIAPEKAEPLEREISAFLRASATGGPAASSPGHVRKTLETALRIRAEMESHAAIVRATVAEHEANQNAT